MPGKRASSVRMLRRDSCAPAASGWSFGFHDSRRHGRPLRDNLFVPSRLSGRSAVAIRLHRLTAMAERKSCSVSANEPIRSRTEAVKRRCGKSLWGLGYVLPRWLAGSGCLRLCAQMMPVSNRGVYGLERATVVCCSIKGAFSCAPATSPSVRRLSRAASKALRGSIALGTSPSEIGEKLPLELVA